MVNRNTVLRPLAFASVLVTILVPMIPAIRPFHFSLLPLFLAFIVHRSTVGQILAVIGTLVIAYVGCLISWCVYGISLEIGAVWSFFPLAIFLVSVFIGSGVNIGARRLYRFLLIVGFLLSVFVLLQVLVPYSSFIRLYIPESRLRSVAHWVSEKRPMIIAPIGNPNNTALLLGLVTLSLSCLAFGTPRIYRRQRILGRVFLLSILVILSIGLILAYARTILVAFILSYAFFFLYSKRGHLVSKVALVIVLVLVLIGGYVVVEVILGANEAKMVSAYYMTTLDPIGSTSLSHRIYEIWLPILYALEARPLLFLTGAGWYEGLVELARGGRTVVDSTHLYLLTAHGVLVWFLFTAKALRIAFGKKALAPLVLFLLVSAFTLPYLTDYRLNIAIGIIFGLIMQLELEAM
jgi:hypothetical protein